jgi:hypothetical protein
MLTVRTKPVGFCLMPMLLFVGIASLSGCRQPPPIPKEGDVVIWSNKWNKDSELIIKAKLGQRREHVIVDARIDHLHYEPEYERFIGQFPIDYNPKPFPTFTEQERIAYETAKRNKKLPPYKSLHPIQFNLMLNGVKAKATDDNPHGGKGMDDSNQVKVSLHGHRILPIRTKSGAKREPYNTQQFFERELMKEMDISSKKTKDGLDCYRFSNGQGGKRCFGHSVYPSISGFSFYVSPDAKDRIFVTSQEFIYGGIKIRWFTNQKNIHRARDIDAAIWRLLDAWNISPLTTPIKN